MTKNIKFKNRITQEDNNTLKILCTNRINMNDDKETINTPDGYFFITIQPNTNLDYDTLRDDFKYVLCKYYRWAIGNRFEKKITQQFKFLGIFEKQAGEYLHIHMIIKSLNIKAINIFVNYITEVFKSIHQASSFSIQRIYNLKDCLEYINPNYNNCLKDIFISKRRTEDPIPFTHADFIKGKQSHTSKIYESYKQENYEDLLHTIFEES